MIGIRNRTNEYEIKDDKSVLDFMYEHKNDDCETYMKAICSNTALWGEDLTQIPGFVSAATDALKKIEMEGAYEVMKQCL